MSILSAAREAEWDANYRAPEVITRQMTDEEKARYAGMNQTSEKQKFTDVTNMKRRGRPPKESPKVQETAGGVPDMDTKPESLEGRVPATINPEFEAAVQEMESQPSASGVVAESVVDLHPDEEIDVCWERAAEVGWSTPDQPIPADDCRSPEGISESLADIIYKFNREYQRGYEAGKAEAAKTLMDALLKMGA